MSKSFSFVRAGVPPLRRLNLAGLNLAGLNLASMKDPRVSVRAALGTLLLLNIVAALILFKPWGGSADDLERQLVSMRQRLPQQQVALAKTKSIAEKVARARGEVEQLMTKYMLNG